MKIGIIGMPQSGKSTIFKLLTGNVTDGKQRANIGVANVPDERINFLSKLFKPKKTTYAKIEFIDMAVAVNNISDDSRKFLDNLRTVDAIIHVVGFFESARYIGGSKFDPIENFEKVNTELLLSDLDLLEKRLVKNNKHKNLNENEYNVLKKCYESLEKEIPIYSLPLSQEETNIIKNYNLLTNKPMICVANLDETQFQQDEYPHKQNFEKYLKERHHPLIKLSALIENEINELDEESRQLFMEDLGIQKPGIYRLARKVYSSLGLISFFTVGKDEVRAWTIKEGSTAKKAAGKIHTDIERGFIRAEVYSFEAIKKYGSEHKIKESGEFRLEGKDYIVKDGDIMSFRFNV